MRYPRPLSTGPATTTYILSTTTHQVSTLYRAVAAETADVTDFDAVRLHFEDDLAEIVRFLRDVLAAAGNLAADLDARLADGADALAQYATATTAGARESAATHAASSLFGGDALFVPEFTLPPVAAGELQKTYDAEATLLRHLTTVEKVDFPVDDWLYGVARVREPMGHWEAVTLLSTALAGVDLALHPAQLPYQEDDSWLALPFPAGYVMEHDHLLYTAHYAAPLRRSEPQCGLLLDEWTEVVPAAAETTGLTFHFDRPNSEPPNAMLLVVPPVLDGHWAWADLVDALHETLGLAQLRAVEPEQVDGTAYGRFLPATLSAVTFTPITIALDLAINNPDAVTGGA